mmetsp:Transcript_9616/g.24460  ORF Transcript_9616/g.24460 Transcript_9616/m.24460 type:complete len:209 (-) Transcript_9616:68-694(-)
MIGAGRRRWPRKEAKPKPRPSVRTASVTVARRRPSGARARRPSRLRRGWMGAGGRGPGSDAGARCAGWAALGAVGAPLWGVAWCCCTCICSRNISSARSTFPALASRKKRAVSSSQPIMPANSATDSVLAPSMAAAAGFVATRARRAQVGRRCSAPGTCCQRYGVRLTPGTRAEAARSPICEPRGGDKRGGYLSYVVCAGVGFTSSQG